MAAAEEIEPQHLPEMVLTTSRLAT